MYDLGTGWELLLLHGWLWAARGGGPDQIRGVLQWCVARSLVTWRRIAGVLGIGSDSRSNRHRNGLPGRSGEIRNAR